MSMYGVSRPPPSYPGATSGHVCINYVPCVMVARSAFFPLLGIFVSFRVVRLLGVTMRRTVVVDLCYTPCAIRTIY